MNSWVVKLIIGLLKLILRLVILAITGEWVDLDKVGKAGAPAPMSGSGQTAGNVDRAALAQRFEELRARQPSDSQPARAHYESFARDVGAPLEQHLRALGVGLRKRTFVALSSVDSADIDLLRDIRAHSRFWPMVISSAPSGPFEPYVVAARARARALAEDTPGLLHRVRLAHGWPTFLSLPTSDRPDVLRGAFGVWLGSLAADVLTTMQLGPGYAWFLARSGDVGNSLPPSRLLSDEPPLLLRLFATLETLEFLGYFEDAEGIARLLGKRLGEAPELTVAMAGDGRPQTLPHEVWRAELQGVLESILEDAQPALGGDTLLDAPGIAFLHGEHARALRLGATLSEGAFDQGRDTHIDASARDWLSAALLVLAQDNREGPRPPGKVRVNEGELARRLHRALGGRAAPRHSQPPAAAGIKNGPRADSRAIQAMLRDPGVIRDAVVLGTLLGPRPRASIRGSRGRFQR